MEVMGKDCVMMDLRKQIEKWRSSKSRQKRMPEELWGMAVDLARRHGVGRVSKELGLGYVGLKSRIEACPIEIQKGTKPIGGGFVELPIVARCGQMRVEVNRPDGCLLRIELGSDFGADVVQIMRAFLGQS